MYFLSTKTLSKTFSLQDNAVHLCASSINTVHNNCTTNPSSKYYREYGKTNYPYTICHQSCGPFVNERTVASPFLEVLFKTFVMKIVWEIVFIYPYFPWCMFFILVVVVALYRNTMSTAIVSAFYKDRAVETQILSIEAERKKQDVLIKKLKELENLNSNDVILQESQKNK